MHSLNQLIAIHSTDVFPERGVMVPGALKFFKNKAGVLEEIAREPYRQTLHWSVNQIAPSHEGGSWSERKIAILTPLTSLESQLVNISALDTFVLGEVKLDSRFTVVAEESVVTTSLPDEVNLVRFRSVEESLMQAVSREIHHLGGTLFNAREATPDTISLVECTHCNETVDRSTFQQFFDQHPRISYGDHMRSETGEAWRLGQLEGILDNFTKVYIHAPLLKNSLMFYCTIQEYDWEDLRTLGLVMDHHLEQLEKSFGDSPAVNELKKQAHKWQQIIKAEYWFQIYCGGLSFQVPHTAEQVKWIQEEILEKDFDALSNEQRTHFLAEAKKHFTRRASYENTTRLKDHLGMLLNGDSLELLKQFRASPKSICSSLLRRWYLTGNRSPFDQALRLGQIEFYKEMFEDINLYRTRAQRPNAIYALRAQEIGLWISDFIRAEIQRQGEKEFKNSLIYCYRMDEKSVEKHLNEL